MTTIDPAVLVGAVAGLVTLQLTSLGILVAVLRFFTVGIPGTLRRRAARRSRRAGRAARRPAARRENMNAR